MPSAGAGARRECISQQSATSRTGDENDAVGRREYNYFCRDGEFVAVLFARSAAVDPTTAGHPQWATISGR
ncbi:hypothetical protein ACFQH6_12365 [Halobacteriaceae archaeon GCM10025711]